MKAKTALPKTIVMNGTEFLTRAGVYEEYLIKETSLYKIVNSKKIQFLKHPTFGICFRREWVDRYFNNQKNFK